MTTARQKVLAHLHKVHTASAKEISRSLRMSPATVRHHLRVLLSEGRLDVGPAGSHEGRGRPDKVYSLPAAALGDNLAALSDALLAETGSWLPVEQLAQRLGGQPEAAGQPLVKRLNRAVEKLNQMNYHAHWEAGSAGPRLVFGHCPYAAIIGKHPELCRMDEALLGQWIGQPGVQISKAGTEGSSVCVFVLGS